MITFAFIVTSILIVFVMVCLGIFVFECKCKWSAMLATALIIIGGFALYGLYLASNELGIPVFKKVN